MTVSCFCKLCDRRMVVDRFGGLQCPAHGPLIAPFYGTRSYTIVVAAGCCASCRTVVANSPAEAISAVLQDSSTLVSLQWPGMPVGAELEISIVRET